MKNALSLEVKAVCETCGNEQAVDAKRWKVNFTQVVTIHPGTCKNCGNTMTSLQAVQMATK